MPSSATITDVEDLLGEDLTASTDRVNRLIERAEGIVAGELPGFVFGAVVDAEVTIDPDGDDFLELPFYPVTGITSVTVNGAALAATDYTFDTLGFVRRRVTSVADPSTDTGLTYRWPDRGVDIVVTYSYGVASATPPAEVVAVVAELAAGRIVNPSQAAQESLGDRSISFGSGGATGDGLNDDQRRRLRHWRRHRFASARVRS